MAVLAFPTPAERKPAKQPKRQEPQTLKETEQYDEPEIAPSSPKPSPATGTVQSAEPSPKEAPLPGRGGRQHKYIQQLVKQLAEERGFRATIEETILDGAGRVDVSLVRNGTRIAFQVSITTTKDWELGGIEKCLAAGYSEVVFIGRSERHIKSFSRFIEQNLDPKDQDQVRYMTSESLIEYLDGFGKPPPSEDVVRGYKVRTEQKSIDSEEAASRRKAISEVIARSLSKSKE